MNSDQPPSATSSGPQSPLPIIDSQSIPTDDLQSGSSEQEEDYQVQPLGQAANVEGGDLDTKNEIDGGTKMEEEVDHEEHQRKEALVQTSPSRSYLTRKRFDIDIGGDTYADACADAYADACADAYADACADAYADACADAYADACADAYADACCDAYADACADAYADACADAYTGSYTESDLADRYTDVDTGTDADACSDAAADVEGSDLDLENEAKNYAEAEDEVNNEEQQAREARVHTSPSSRSYLKKKRGVLDVDADYTDACTNANADAYVNVDDDDMDSCSDATADVEGTDLEPKNEVDDDFKVEDGIDDTENQHKQANAQSSPSLQSYLKKKRVDPDANSYAYSNAYSYASRYAKARGFTFADAYAEAYADARTNACKDTYADAYANARANARKDAYADAYANAVRANSRVDNGDPNASIDDNATTCADATASASPIADTGATNTAAVDTVDDDTVEGISSKPH
ncbi:hypothetical protein L1049_015206 [Liquidambar formosana]|uniref:Uncharacterized protein n=1 Tax=Liquidambar formosana TaxID=63359 RepID=A0AAP0S3B2_LIQFO